MAAQSRVERPLWVRLLVRVATVAVVVVPGVVALVLLLWGGDKYL